MDRSWTARLDSLRVFWYRRIVNFDQQSQLETLRSVKHATENSGKRLRQALESTVAEIKSWLLAPWGGKRLLGLMGVVAVLTAVIWMLRRLQFPMIRTLLKPHWWRAPDVRERAGMWLRRMGRRPVTAETASVVANLQRLRYGPNVAWSDAADIFSEARRAWKRPIRKSITTT
jgi:hypothetical protein